MPRPRSFARIAILSSLPAERKRPYWSCMIRAQERKVILSMPRILSISLFVSLAFSLLRLFHSPFSPSSEMFTVPLPDFVLVLVTRNRWFPISNTNSMEPDLVSSVARSQEFLSPSLVISNRQSLIASMKSDDLPAPFTPLMEQKVTLSKSNSASL